MTSQTRPRGTALLIGAWALSLLIGLASSGMVAAGFLRDTHFGEGRVALDIGSEDGWHGVKFRPWSTGPHQLWLTTLGPQPPFDPDRPDDPPATQARSFDGRLEIRLRTGTAVLFEQTFVGEDLGHVAGEGMTWTRLDELDLSGSPLRTLELEARVVGADPAFATPGEFHSEILLRRDRPDVGMGGLINYAMIVPAVLFLAVSLALGLFLGSRGGPRAPSLISGGVLGFFLLLAFFR